MVAENRSAIVRAFLGGLALVLMAIPAIGAVTNPAFWGGSLPLTERLPQILDIAATILLVGAVFNLGISTSYGEIRFLSTAILMAYFAFGQSGGALITGAGLIAGGVLLLVRTQQSSRGQRRRIWQDLSAIVWEIGANGLSLLAADIAYRDLGGLAPLRALSSLEAVLPIIAASIIYLMLYNLLLVLDLALREQPVISMLTQSRRALLGVQLIPIMLPPLGALVLSGVGAYGFILMVFIVAVIVLVLNQLSITQNRLEDQVSRLETISEVNRSLSASLEMNALLPQIATQLASALHVPNLDLAVTVALEEQDEWRPVFALREGTSAPVPPGLPIDGLIRQVLRSGRPVIAAPAQPLIEAQRIQNPPDASAWIGVPLQASGRTIGAVSVWHPQQATGHHFSTEDLATLESLASATGVALYNALLYEESQLTAAQLSRLNQISAMLNASLNPERLLEMVCESVLAVVGCDKAAIYLLESESEDPRLILAQAHGFSPEHIVRSRDISVPLTDEERVRVFQQSEAVLLPDLYADVERVSAAALLLAREEGFKCYAYLPLQANNQVIGMLAVYYDEVHIFSPREVRLLETFGNQAALAVTNARIYQHVDIQLARRIGQIVRMADISQRLSSTLEMEQIFNLVIDSAIEGCNADAGMLVLTEDPELGRGTKALNMVAWRGLDPTSKTRAPHHVVQRIAESHIFESGQLVLQSGDSSNFSAPNSHMSVPILLEERVIGAIALESDMINAFNQDDLAFVSQLAVQAAVAIRNGQLYRHAQSVRDRLSAILDASNDGLLMIDAKSRIVMTNTRMKDFWDFARQDFRPRSPDQFLADPLSALGEGLGYEEGELSELLGRGIRNPGMQPRTDLYATSGTGSRQRFVERTAAPVRDEAGNFIGLLLLFRDVTEQKELEEARNNLSELIVHDLRAPLQAMAGSLRLFETVGSKAPEERDRKLVTQAAELSNRALKKLLNMVNNLLDLSRMERGEIQIDAAIENLPGILEDIAQDLKPLAQEMDALIQVEPAQEVPPAYVDRDLIERVVLNLADNGLKYSEAGTIIRLRAGVWTPPERDGKEQKPMLRVDVLDQGPGVPDEFKMSIFERFSMVPGRKGRRASAGLGLAFCRLAVESHGGRIWVEDGPEGQGSCFSFTVPIANAPEQARE